MYGEGVGRCRLLLVRESVQSFLPTPIATVALRTRVRPAAPTVPCAAVPCVQVPFEGYRLGALAGLHMSMTGFNEAGQREQLAASIAANGGRYTPDLFRQCTHLIARTAGGPKFTCVGAARRGVCTCVWVSVRVCRARVTVGTNGGAEGCGVATPPCLYMCGGRGGGAFLRPVVRTQLWPCCWPAVGPQGPLRHRPQGCLTHQSDHLTMHPRPSAAACRPPLCVCTGTPRRGGCTW